MLFNEFAANNPAVYFYNFSIFIYLQSTFYCMMIKLLLLFLRLVSQLFKLTIFSPSYNTENYNNTLKSILFFLFHYFS